MKLGWWCAVVLLGVLTGCAGQERTDNVGERRDDNSDAVVDVATATPSVLQVSRFTQVPGPGFTFRLRAGTVHGLPGRRGVVGLYPFDGDASGTVASTAFEIDTPGGSDNWMSPVLGLTFARQHDDGHYVLVVRWDSTGDAPPVVRSLGVVELRNRRRSVTFQPSAPVNYAQPPEIAAWTETDKQQQKQRGAKVLGDLREAIRRGEASFTFPKGHYRFDGEPGAGGFPRVALFEGVQDMTIDGNGSTIWLTQPGQAGFVFQNCKNLTVRNLAFDADPLPYAQGKVVAISTLPVGGRPHPAITGKIVFKLDPGFEQSVRRMMPDQYRKGAEIRVHIFDDNPGLGYPIKETWGAGHSGKRPVTQREDGSYEIYFQSVFDSPQHAGIEVGDLVALTPRFGRSPMRVYASTWVNVEDVTVYASSRFGLLADHLQGPCRFRRYRLMRRPNTRRLVAANMDGFHFNYCSVGPHVVDSVIEGAMDDGIALASMNSRVIDPRPADPRKLVIGTRHRTVAVNAAAGTTLKVCSDGECELRGEATVVAVERVKELGDLPEKVKSWHKAYFWNNSETFYLVTLDKPLVAETGDYVITNKWSGDGFMFKSNLIKHCWANGMRLTGNHGTIADNIIEDAGGILFSPSPWWLIGVFARGVEIRDNTLRRIRPGAGQDVVPLFIGAGTAKATGKLHSRFTITGNTIVDCSYAGIVLSNMRDVTLADNVIINSNRRRYAHIPGNPFSDNLTDLNYGLIIRACRDVTGGGNRVVQPGPHCKGLLNLGKHNDADTIDVEVK